MDRPERPSFRLSGLVNGEWDERDAQIGPVQLDSGASIRADVGFVRAASLAQFSPRSPTGVDRLRSLCYAQAAQVAAAQSGLRPV